MNLHIFTFLQIYMFNFGLSPVAVRKILILAKQPTLLYTIKSFYNF